MLKYNDPYLTKVEIEIYVMRFNILSNSCVKKNNLIINVF